MVVWGGQVNISDAAYGLLDTGGRYDPVADSWTPTTTIGVPPLSSRHAAVWTGREMIIWGGVNANTGGRYNPASDSWKPTTTVDSPSPRYLHAMTWTGNTMLVWGGLSSLSSIPLETGGQYVPDVIGEAATANAGSDQVVECAGQIGTEVTLGGSATTCPPNQAVTYTWRGPFSEGNGTVTGSAPVITLPVGSSGVVLTVEDGQGHIAEDSVMITVRDSVPPVITCPSVGPTECTTTEGTQVDLPLAQAVDVCDEQPAVVNSGGSGGSDASGMYPLGQTEVQMTATDASGNQAGCSFPVTVHDTIPPLATSSIVPPILWPPNHRMVDVRATVQTTDACSTPTVVLASVISSETDDDPGGIDGSTTGDVQGAQVGTADFEFQMRAERNGSGDGRAYRVTYAAIDSSGNQATASSLVLVPHDQGGASEPLLISAQEGASGTFLQWSAVPGANTYRVVRGSIRSLQGSGDFIDLGTVVCIQPGSSSTDTKGQADTEIPPLGEAFFYLVSYNDGQDTGYGSDTATKPRVKTGGGCK
jgi:HYR domain-containing protein